MAGWAEDPQHPEQKFGRYSSVEPDQNGVFPLPPFVNLWADHQEDGVMRVWLYSLADNPQGGRDTVVPAHAQFLPVPLVAPGAPNLWDCRLILDGRDLHPGHQYDLRVVFLSPRDATQNIQPGTAVGLGPQGRHGVGVLLSLSEELLG